VPQVIQLLHAAYVAATAAAPTQVTVGTAQGATCAAAGSLQLATAAALAANVQQASQVKQDQHLRMRVYPCLDLAAIAPCAHQVSYVTHITVTSVLDGLHKSGGLADLCWLLGACNDQWQLSPTCLCPTKRLNCTCNS
jgi:hypothetical protein